MSASLQTLIVALIIAACALHVARRFAPKAMWRLQASLAFALERPGRPAWTCAVGRWLRPGDIRSACGTGSDGACRTCGTCATGDAAAAKPTG